MVKRVTGMRSPRDVHYRNGLEKRKKFCIFYMPFSFDSKFFFALHLSSDFCMVFLGKGLVGSGLHLHFDLFVCLIVDRHLVLFSDNVNMQTLIA